MAKSSQNGQNKYTGGGAEYLRKTGKTAVHVYMTVDEKELLRQAAEVTGRNLSQFILYFALKAAKKELHEK